MTFTEFKRLQRKNATRKFVLWSIVWLALGWIAGWLIQSNYISIVRDHEAEKRHKIECELNELYEFELYEGCRR